MSEGVWLDQIPHEPAPLGCVECANPVLPLHAMCAVVGGKPVTPLCMLCYENLT
jgi:hypothetical protein